MNRKPLTFTWTSVFWFLMGALAAKCVLPVLLIGALFWATSLYGQGPHLPPRRPETALALALADLQSLPKAQQPFVRYLWLPDGSDQAYAAAVVALNTAVNQSDFAMEPQRVASGALIRVNLLQFIDNQGQLDRLTKTWDSLAWHDPYFSLVTSGHHEPCKPYKAADGKTYDYKAVDAFISPAPYLMAQFTPGLIYRSDWFVARSLSSIDGDFYLTFRNLVPNQTKLGDYLKSREAVRPKTIEAAVVDKSKITGKKRSVEYWFGQGSRPTTGPPLAIFTRDTFQGNNDPRSNPLASLLDNTPDAGELMIRLPNGFWEFTLWKIDNKDVNNSTLLAEVDSRVATDNRVPDPFPHRLQGAISCIRCHGEDTMLKPFNNEVHQLLASQGRLLTDVSQGFDDEDQLKAVRTILTRFGAEQLDLNGMLEDSRMAFNRRVFSLTKQAGVRQDAIAASKATAAVYDAYEFGDISAATACREWGIAPADGDANGVLTLRKILPPLEPNGLTPDSGGIAQLETEWTDPLTRKKLCSVLTRREFEQIYQIGADRTRPAVEALNQVEVEK